MVADLFSGRSLTIDGLHVILLDPGLISVPPLMRRVRHRYVLCSAKRDAVQFCQLREREGAICSYYEIQGDCTHYPMNCPPGWCPNSGGWLCNWYHQTEFRAFNLYYYNKQRTIVVVEVICGTDFRGTAEGATRSHRRFSSNYWGIVRITHQWTKIRGGLFAVWEEACETARRMNQGE